MKEFARTAKRAAVIAATGLTLAAITAGPAAAGTDGVHLVRKGTFNTLSACRDAGNFDVSQGHVDQYRCYAEGTKWAYYWYYY